MRLDYNLLRHLIREALLNAYDVLGVPPGASDEEIKSAWKKMALQKHPDRGGKHGDMVDLNNAKDRLLDKTAMFRFGPTFKGYEDPNAPKPPHLEKCPVCHRDVNVKDDKFVNHYKVAGGTEKCPNSGQKAPVAPSPGGNGYGGGGYRDPEADFWQDFFRRSQDHARQQRQDRERRDRERAERAERDRARAEQERAAAGARARANAPPPPGADQYRWRYYENRQGRSSKFWEVKPGRDACCQISWGRIGADGFTQNKCFRSEASMFAWIREMVGKKMDGGYYSVERPANRANARPTSSGRSDPRPQQPAGQAAGAPPAGGAAAGGAAPGAAAAGKQYKVYGNVKGKASGDQTSQSYWPHTRVKGQAYAPTGDKRGRSKFHQNDRVNVNVNPQTRKAKVSGKYKNYSPGHHGEETDHSQDWDPITQEAAWKMVDRAVAEYLAEVVSR